MLNDSPAHIDFHIQAGDYFAFLATMMGFVEEALERCESEGVTDKERIAARELRRDLCYVQANYQITPRPHAEIQTIHTSGNLLGQR
ncbi:MAG: hypothetical protein JWM39_515 [Parcubacteria group bacterium]|nr:hypothetical protein [Parcubacteria group bacterium]